MKHESVFDPYPQGPKGENVGSITQPLPSNYLIFRAASESDGEASEGAASCMFDETIYMQPNWSTLLPLKKKKNLLSRSVLDGCPGAGSELLQPLQADGQSWERRRYQHDFRVLPYTEPAAVHGTHWYRAAAVSHKLTQLDPRTYDWFQSFFYNLLLLDQRWFLYSRFA